MLDYAKYYQIIKQWFKYKTDSNGSQADTVPFINLYIVYFILFVWLSQRKRDICIFLEIYFITF